MTDDVDQTEGRKARRRRWGVGDHDGVGVVDHWDRLHHHAIGKIWYAEIDQDQVEGSWEEALLLSYCCDHH